MNKFFRIVCCALTLILAFTCIAPSAFAADKKESASSIKEVPLLVIIASFDENGNGIDD